MWGYFLYFPAVRTTLEPSVKVTSILSARYAPQPPPLSPQLQKHDLSLHSSHRGVEGGEVVICVFSFHL